MIEHREDQEVGRVQRPRRPTLARTLCHRWVDVVRLALPERPTTCAGCLRQELRKAGAATAAS